MEQPPPRTPVFRESLPATWRCSTRRRGLPCIVMIFKRNLNCLCRLEGQFAAPQFRTQRPGFFNSPLIEGNAVLDQVQDPSH
jgi:hypothetical protein